MSSRFLDEGPLVDISDILQRIGFFTRTMKLDIADERWLKDDQKGGVFLPSVGRTRMLPSSPTADPLLAQLSDTSWLV